MRSRHPIETVTPTVDGPVLEVLAREPDALTAAQIQVRLEDYSVEGIRRALSRLTFQGTVMRSGTSRRYLYRLNRDHVAAAAVVHLASLRQELLARMRREIGSWRPAPVAVAVRFDRAPSRAWKDPVVILLVRDVSDDGRWWGRQVTHLEEGMLRWSGNPVIIQQAVADARHATSCDAPLVHHHVLFGSPDLLAAYFPAPRGGVHSILTQRPPSGDSGSVASTP